MKDVITDLAKYWVPSSNGGEVYLSLDYEPCEVDEILSYLCTEGTVWSETYFYVKGYKSYDEYGNSEKVGVLIFETKGRTKNDMQVLAKLWEDALTHF